MNALSLENTEVRKVIENYEKEIKKLKKERERFLVIAYNAICFGQLDEMYDEDELLEELGCTQEEYDEIMEI